MENQMAYSLETHTDDEIADFFYDQLVINDVEFPITIYELLSWASDVGDEFQLSVLLACGYEVLGWDAPGDDEITEERLVRWMMDGPTDHVDRIGADLHKEWLLARGTEKRSLKEQIDRLEDLRCEYER